MNTDATAAALVHDTAMPEAPAEAPQADLSAELEAVWNNAQDEAPEQEPEKEAPAAVKPVEEPEAPAPAVEVPSDLPQALKARWAELPEEARQDIHAYTRETNARLSEQGRLVQGIEPIKAELVQLAKDLPEFAEMRPEQVAKEMRTFRDTVLAPLSTQPVETLVRVAQERGVADQLRAALGGEASQAGPQMAQMAQVIKQQQAQIAQLSDPGRMKEQFQAFSAEDQMNAKVNEFASNADHWSEVETHMPLAIQLTRARMGAGTSTEDILSAAYELAVGQFVPNAIKASEPPAAGQAASAPDPEKAMKAKSVNVSGQPSKPRPRTLQEEREAIWDRRNKS